MNRQSLCKGQESNKPALQTATNLLHRTLSTRAGFDTSTSDGRNSLERQNDSPWFQGAETTLRHDFSRIPVKLNSPYPIQAKLKIGAPNDKYEQEADRVAEQVMRMPDPYTSSINTGLPANNSPMSSNATIQRTCSACANEYKVAEEEKRAVQSANLCPKCCSGKNLIQTKANGFSTPVVSRTVSSGIQTLQGGGLPLSWSERNFFEPRFGVDFSGVRVHNDTRAADLARSVNARAFTYGNNVVFGAGEYRSDSVAGKKLLGHELTHTLQQSAAVRPIVMCATAEDCTKKGKTNSDLLAVHDEARKLLHIAIDKTAKRDKRGERTAEVKSALLKWFKIDLDSKVNQFQNVRAFLHVIDAMDSTFNGSDNVAYECDENGFFEVCKPGRNAVTLSNIHICPSWWDLPKDRKPIVLIHEWTHKFGKGVNRVFETYCWDKEFAKLSRDERVKMPDAYEGYISVLSQGTGTC